MDAKQVSQDIVKAAKEAGIEKPEDLVAFALGFQATALAKNDDGASKTSDSSTKKSTDGLGPSQTWKRSRMRIEDVLAAGLDLVDQEITVAGWIRTIRKMEPAFMHLNDGSCVGTVQCIVDKAFTKEGYEAVMEDNSVATGASVTAFGKVVKSPAKGQVIEIQCSKIVVHGTIQNTKKYPMSKKFHTVERMRDFMHLRPRSNLIAAVTRCRNACAYATHKFFNDRKFMYIHTPLITASDCEGAGEMFSVSTLLDHAKETDPKTGKIRGLPMTKDGKVDFGQDFFKKPAYLTVSGQLNVECFSCSMSDVYTFGPTFRAENSHTSRHLAEFWMIEPEIAFADLEDNMRLAEDYLKFCVQFVLDNCDEDLRFFEDKKIEVGLRERLRNVVKEPFHRITYTDAVDLLIQDARAKKVKFNRKLQKKDPLRWGIDLRSEHEKYLTEVKFKKPVIVTDYPASFKAFYMRMNDGCEKGKETVRAMDILVPGIGEIIGGAQREERIEKLEERIRAQGSDPADFKWYADLRRYGTVPHAGFGLGFERLVQFCTGVNNIRDVIPFPRWPGNAAF